MGEVDQSQLMRYIELEKEIQQIESQNPLKDYEVKKKAADDVAETIKQVDITLQQLVLQTKKEKADVDNMHKDKSIGDMFKSEADFNAQLSREQEEYLEAKNKEEVARQSLEDLKKQHSELESKASQCKGPGDKLKCLYEERDKLLSDIFGGEYGSDKENHLEAMFDSLMDKKQRVSVAHYKWTNGRILLQHAVNQMTHAVNRWQDLPKAKEVQLKYPLATEVRNNLIASLQNVNGTQRYLGTIDFPYCKPCEMETLQRAVNNIYTEAQLRYNIATEARNNNIASIQNIRSCARYLGNKIEFPYMKPEEVCMLENATNHIYTDMADQGRHKHAHQCYNVTRQRAAALLQWFDVVIKETIQTDLTKVTEEARKVEKELRAERIKLIRDKVAECGGDVKGLNDADQQQISDDDMDMKGIGVTRPAPVSDRELPDAECDDHGPPAPTPLPLSELAPMPTENDLFGDISDLKEKFKKHNEDFMKTQDMNKARMEQGLQAKLAARRHKKK